MSTVKPKAAKASPAPERTPVKPAPAKKSAVKAVTKSAPVPNPVPAPYMVAVAAATPTAVTPAAPVAAVRAVGTTPAGSRARASARKSPVLAAALAANKPETPARAQTGQGAPVAQAPDAPIDAKLEKKLASNPPRALNSPIRIFQIYFEAWQRELLDPAFYPLDNSRGTSELMEFDVFEQLQRNAATKGATLWGALSWRFGEKTGMQGAEWVKQIVDHPGSDVYYCNPHPHNEGLFHNMWMQGETAHPQFLEVVKAFFTAVGMDEKDLSSIHASTAYSAANYFVASPRFWERYIAFVRKSLAAADKRMPPDLRDLMHSRTADDRNLHAGATYVPFIVERLFPIFMATEGKDLKAHKIALPEREREMNVHLKLLREMKDVAHKTQSAWLAACWVNYRNLYMSQTNGKAWCEKYLRAITPTEVRFG